MVQDKLLDFCLMEKSISITDRAYNSISHLNSLSQKGHGIIDACKVNNGGLIAKFLKNNITSQGTLLLYDTRKGIGYSYRNQTASHLLITNSIVDAEPYETYKMTENLTNDLK